MERVGFGARLGASIIDFIIICVVMLVVGLLTGASLLGGLMGAGSSPDMADNMAVGLGGAMLVMWLIALAYSSLEIWRAATPGKMILGLRIKSEDGSAAATNVLTTRWALKNGSSILTMLAGLLGLAVLSTVGTVWGLIVLLGFLLTLGAARQALHDKIAKSAVYRA